MFAHVCACVSEYAHTDIHTLSHTHIHGHTHTRTHAHILTHARNTYANIHKHTHAHKLTCTHTHTRTHKYIHTRTRTRTHTHTQTHSHAHQNSLTNAFKHTCAKTHTRTHTHTHTLTHKHMHQIKNTHTRTQKPMQKRMYTNNHEHTRTKIELASFSLQVFSTVGGMGTKATVVYKRLASILSDKHNQPYSNIVDWLRCRLSFFLLRSSIRFLQGSRSSIHDPAGPLTETHSTLPVVKEGSQTSVYYMV